MIFEGRAAGIDFFDIYDWTAREVCDFIEIKRERNRREDQRRAVIAFRQAALIAKMIAGQGEEYSVIDEFPFWNEEERKEALVDKYRRRMGG